MTLNVKNIEAHTPAAIEAGVRQFQSFLCGSTDVEHAGRLLDLMNLPCGATVIDAGCGIGETARLMREVRPDLKFVLINLAQGQLDFCPDGMDRHNADFCAMPLGDGVVDAVFYSHSACQCDDWIRMLDEARRVLKPTGTVFIHDIADTGGADVEAWAAIGAQVLTPDEMARRARGAGFAVDDVLLLEKSVDQLAKLTDGAAHERLAAGVECAFLVLHPISDPVQQVLSRHERVGFQFSGGRDSTVALYMLRQWWPQITVYHVDAGDQFPESRSVVARVRADIETAGGRFEVIFTDVEKSRQEFGLPSDLVPADNTPFGQLVAGKATTIVGRYDCCWRNIMWPMHQRMQEDGITLIVRGQRDDEYATPPLRNGDVAGGIEFLYPVQGWTGDQVEEYLRSRSLPIADFYPEGVLRASDCMTCTAWWDDGRAQYLKRFHPKAHGIFISRAQQVREAIDRQRAWLDHELEA